MRKSRKSIRYFEICAVVLTGLLKFVLVDWLQVKFLYIILAVSFWAVYIFLKKSHISYFGFRKENLGITFLYLAVFSVLSGIAFFIYGSSNDLLVLNYNLIYILLLYPIWGLIQQFLIMGLIAGNLNDLENKTIPKFWIVLLTSIVFAMVHYPSWILIGGTFALAIYYTIIYLKYRNLWPLGVFHGWIGGLFYYWVLGRDAWAEFIGML